MFSIQQLDIMEPAKNPNPQESILPEVIAYLMKQISQWE